VRGAMHEGTQVTSGPDDGIYDALNKGIAMARGDIVGLLHSDDYFADDSVLAQVAEAFGDPDLDVVYADAAFFTPSAPSKITRRFRSKRFAPDMIARGWMPAHPTMFIRKRVFDEFGLYKTHYKIAGDFEFVARIFRSGQVRARYVNRIWVMMQSGGASTAGLKAKWILNTEVIRGCRENGIKTNLAQVLMKYPAKFLERF